MKAVNQIGLLSMIGQLSRSNAVFYANPSFGYYFEQFYQEPHGLIYRLKELPTNNLVPPAPNKTLIAENESFWSQAVPLGFPGVKKALNPPDYFFSANFFDWVLMHLHATADANPNPVFAGTYYSRSLNFWASSSSAPGSLIWRHPPSPTRRR